MDHKIYKIISIEFVGPYSLKLSFDDGLVRTIDFFPILQGPIYGPLKDEILFNRAVIDKEIHTVVWPNGADFDPEILHDWPEYVEDFVKLTQSTEYSALQCAEQKPKYSNGNTK